MKEEITVNGYPVVISVAHKTVKPMAGGIAISGDKFIAECYSMEEVSEVVNNPDNTPEAGWYWDIQFQDKVSPVQKCDCPKGTCLQWFLASDEVGEDCKAVFK